MAATTAPIASIGSYAARRERRKAIAYGVFFLLVALAIFFFFVRNSAPGMESTFKLNPTTKEKVIQLGDLVLPTYQTLILLATIVGLLGLYQIVRGFKHVVVVLGIVALLFVFAFLVWAVRDKSINLLGILTFTVAAATPIAFGAMSGVMCERSGVINIAIEGMMLTGAMVAVIFSSISGSLWLGLASAVIASGLLGVFLAILAIHFRVDQIIAGTAINIFALGITSFISQRFLQPNPALNSGGVFSKVAIPGLSQIPIIGPIFFNQTPIVYILFLTILAIHFMLFYTRWGLRTRAVGEHPRAADTLGVNVFKVRYINVIIGGMIAGVGGSYFTIGSVGRFDEAITAGKGFIGLAAMIFGRWTPFGAYGASLIFGFSDALQARLQVLGKTQVPIPSEWLLILPYVVTMIVLAGVVGKTVAPAADGKPYTKD
ncbi:MAG TPA: ABC transporter permease [Anaerolineae bacterium]|nr:ABC transporter permease [Anaerolineae bacterium]